MKPGELQLSPFPKPPHQGREDR